MDYCARESTLNPVREDVRDQTIRMNIQETYNILTEMNDKLNEFSQIVDGKPHEEKGQKSVASLWDESRMLVALAYNNLQMLDEIKKSII